MISGRLPSSPSDGFGCRPPRAGPSVHVQFKSLTNHGDGDEEMGDAGGYDDDAALCADGWVDRDLCLRDVVTREGKYDGTRGKYEEIRAKWK